MRKTKKCDQKNAVAEAVPATTEEILLPPKKSNLKKTNKCDQKNVVAKAEPAKQKNVDSKIASTLQKKKKEGLADADGKAKEQVRDIYNILWFGAGRVP